MLMMMNKKNYFPMNQYTYTHCSCYSKLFSLLNECCTRFNVLSLLNCSLRCFFIYIEMAFWIFVFFFFFVSFFLNMRVYICGVYVISLQAFLSLSLRVVSQSDAVAVYVCSSDMKHFRKWQTCFMWEEGFFIFWENKKNNNNKNKK